jgi:hypothetical protein
MADKKITLRSAYKRVIESKPSDLYLLMKEHIPAIMEESNTPFCEKCLAQFIERMKELSE